MSGLEKVRRRVETLQIDYVQCIDDDELERWPELFVDPCFYHIVARDNFEAGRPIGVMRYESVAMLRDQVTATRHAAVFAPRAIRHILGGTRIVGEADGEIRAHTSVAIYQTNADGETLLMMTAQYRDVIVEAGANELRFREKRVVYDTLQLPDSVIYPL